LHIRFFNTFEPVVPLYKSVFPQCKKKGFQCVALMSQGIYKEIGDEKDSFLHEYAEFIYVPSFFRKNKRWCVLFYWLLAPLKLILSRSDLNVFLTQPPLFFILGSAISKLKKTPYIIHLMDMYPDILVPMGFITNRSIIYSFLSRLAARSLKGSDGVFVLGRCMKNNIIEKGINPSKISIFHNWANENIYPIQNRNNQFRKIHNLENKFIIMYSGNMGIAHELETILKVAERVRQFSDMIFVFIGSGVRKSLIEKAIARGGSNLLLLDYQPLNLLPHSLSAADVHFMSLIDGFEGLMVPSKFYGALASGRPILFEGNKTSEVALAINEIGCGRVIMHGDVNGLHESVMYYRNSPNPYDDGVRAWNAHQNQYRAEFSTELYVDTVIKILRDSTKAHKEMLWKSN